MRIFKYIFLFLVSTCSVFAQLDIGRLRGTVPVTKGGTGRSYLTEGYLLVGNGSQSIRLIPNGAAGTILISAGTDTVPAWSTSTFPTVSGLAGKILISDGTNLDTSSYIVPTSISQGDLLYAKTADSLVVLPKSVIPVQYLSNTGTGNSPAWGYVDLTSGVSNYVLVSNGGTGAVTLSDRGVLIGRGTAAINATVPGTAKQHLKSGGSSANPGWTTATYPDTVPMGAFAYGSAVNTWGNLAPGLEGTLIRMGTSNTPAWTSATYPSVTAVNRILYSSAENVIGEITTANDGVLVTSAVGIPSISSTLPDSLTTGIMLFTDHIEQQTPAHLFAAFEDSSVLIDIGADSTWYQVTNSIDSLFGYLDKDYFTVNNDTIIYTGSGEPHVLFQCRVTGSGANTKDFELRMFNVTDNAGVLSKDRKTTTGASNYVGFTFLGYDKNINYGDKYILQIRCITDASDFTVKDGMIFAQITHY